MNTKETLGFNAPSTRSRSSQKQKNEVRRQDWGFTDQYRRMMQRDTRRKEGQKE